MTEDAWRAAYDRWKTTDPREGDPYEGSACAQCGRSFTHRDVFIVSGDPPAPYCSERCVRIAAQEAHDWQEEREARRR